MYAEDAPSRLPWHELALGLGRRCARWLRVAYRVWVVSSVWLVVVPWVTCLAWRLAFLPSLEAVPAMLRARASVLAVATDCVQVRFVCWVCVFGVVGGWLWVLQVRDCLSLFKYA